MRKIAGYLTKNRSEKDQKIAQSTHENRYIKPRKTFWRNSKQLLNSNTHSKSAHDKFETDSIIWFYAKSKKKDAIPPTTRQQSVQ
ncbi:hypothetical protein B5F71_18735 [Bacteroides sp. An269]|nr:hypothetical protein B5F71_18735 [Bacteroides sp. An269]